MLENLGFLLVLFGFGLAAYFGFSSQAFVMIFIPALILGFGAMLMQTKNGKLFNLYYRETQGMQHHGKGIAYLSKLFVGQVLLFGVVSLPFFFIARLFS